MHLARRTWLWHGIDFMHARTSVGSLAMLRTPLACLPAPGRDLVGLGLRLSSVLPGQGLYRWSSSQFNGVCWNKSAGKYRARFCLDNRQHHVGSFVSEVEAAQACDAGLRAMCADRARLKRSLNFPTLAEASFTESRLEARTRGLSRYGQTGRKEEESFERLQRCFLRSPQALTYTITRVSGSSHIDALVEAKASCAGGVPLQLKSASCRGNTFKTYKFNKARGYHGMLLVLVALDRDMFWAVPGNVVTRSSLSVTLGSARDSSWRVQNLGLLLETCCSRSTDFPSITLEEALQQCSCFHRVEVQAHLLLARLLSTGSFQLRRSFPNSAAVDSVLAGQGLEWRVQEKASNLRRCGTYAANLSKHGGALGRIAYTDNDFDLLLASVLDNGRLAGLFVFPIEVLSRLGAVGQKPVKLILYPPWNLAKREAIRLKHAWQLEYFVDLRAWDGEGPLSDDARSCLEHLLDRLAACHGKRTEIQPCEG